MRVLTLVILASIGCATASKLNKVNIGMTKPEVISVMGNPDTTEGTTDSEVLVYRLYDSGENSFAGLSTDYVVVLSNGRVVSYGRQQHKKLPVIFTKPVK